MIDRSQTGKCRIACHACGLESQSDVWTVVDELNRSELVEGVENAVVFNTVTAPNAELRWSDNLVGSVSNGRAAKSCKIKCLEAEKKGRGGYGSQTRADRQMVELLVAKGARWQNSGHLRSGAGQ